MPKKAKKAKSPSRRRTTNDSVEVSPARLDEIVNEIVKTLQPLKTGKTETELESGIRNSIDVAPKMACPWEKMEDRFPQQKASARKLASAFANLEQSLRDAQLSGFLLWKLFGDSTRNVPNFPQDIDELPRIIKRRSEAFLKSLASMRAMCEKEANAEHKSAYWNKNTLKNYLAWHMYGIMRETSQRNPTGTSGGPFLVCTGLLYEAVTGLPADETGSGVRSHCLDVIREIKGEVPPGLE